MAIFASQPCIPVFCADKSKAYKMGHEEMINISEEDLKLLVSG